MSAPNLSLEELLRHYRRIEESRFSGDSRTGDAGALCAINDALDQILWLRKDAARLDFLAEGNYTVEWLLNTYGSDLRAAIDAARGTE